MSGEDPDKTDDDEQSIWDEIGDINDADNEFDPSTETVETESSETVETESSEAIETESDEPNESDEVNEPNTNTPPESARAPTTDELFDEIDAGNPPDGTEGLDADEIFDQMDVSQVDGEALWDELAGFESGTDEPSTAATGSTGNPNVTVDGVVDETGDNRQSASQNDPAEQSETDGDETVVDKRTYCQQCPYFSEPPDVACSHEGTTIVEVLMDGQFRLRNCPVVTDSGPDRTILNDGN